MQVSFRARLPKMWKTFSSLRSTRPFCIALLANNFFKSLNYSHCFETQKLSSYRPVGAGTGETRFLKTMDNQRLDPGSHRPRYLTALSRSTSMFADNSTFRPGTEEYATGHVTERRSSSTNYAFARPESASTIPLEPSPFMACSWEPSLLTLSVDRKVPAHNYTIHTGPHTCYPTSILPQANAPFEHVLSAQYGFFNPNIAAFDSPPLEEDTSQLPLSRRNPVLDHGFLSPSHFQALHGPQYSPMRNTQGSKGVATTPPYNFSNENKRPTVSHHKRVQDQPSKMAYVEPAGKSDKPYAYLLYEALRSAKDHKLSLQAIYRWFEDNTNKANDPNRKGWQSSVRHNLSMNEVSTNPSIPYLNHKHLTFARQAFILCYESSGPGKSKKNYWTLTREALQHGVQSTTRYRNTILKKPVEDEEGVGLQHGGPGSKEEGNIPKYASRSRRISHLSEVNTKRPLPSSHHYSNQQVQQRLNEQQTAVEMRDLDQQATSVFISKPNRKSTPNIAKLTAVSSVDLQCDLARSHWPSGIYYDHDYR